ncbi:MAG TPA: rhodanese-like domain-containing protein [Pyrinomonadaceae bacterium]|nr:rhodanese-like domain-containing protein [Pyrinomonadaceae bacterium]
MKRGILLARIFGALTLICASLVCVQMAHAQEVERITVDELKTLMARGSVFILDVRSSGETKIKGARHIPLDQLESRLKELPARGEREIVTYCA